MNRFVVAAALMTSAPFAHACDQGKEAQFNATVSTVVKSDLPELCVVKFASVQSWSENALCPLDVEDTQSKMILAKCDLKAGDQVSGVMIDNGGTFLSWQ